MTAINNHYQNIIIGFGKGGKTLAAWLSANGQQVAIIEQSEAMYGGSCINIACIPSKSLVNSAHQGIPYAEAHQIKDSLTSALRKKNYDKIAQSSNGVVIDGKARFLGPRELQVATASGNFKMTADRIFINTGTIPFMPDIPGVDGQHIYNSTTLMELSERPRHLVIVGGGYVGLEFAAMFLKFGAKVTMIDHHRSFLPGEDRDLADVIGKDLTAQGLEMISGADVNAFSEAPENADKVITHYTKDKNRFTLMADSVLIATGRQPATEALQLEKAGIQTDQKGYIKVNDQLQTTAQNIWAIGDVNGGPQFTYISLDDFRIIKNQLSGGSYRSVHQRKAYASCIFIEPTYARIGLNETQAREQGLDYRVFKLPAANIPKAAILRQKNGLLKAVVEKSSGKILGCMLYCAEAHELINTVQLAMQAGLPYEDMRDNIYTHPTMTEAFNDLFAG